MATQSEIEQLKASRAQLRKLIVAEVNRVDAVESEVAELEENVHPKQRGVGVAMSPGAVDAAARLGEVAQQLVSKREQLARLAAMRASWSQLAEQKMEILQQHEEQVQHVEQEVARLEQAKHTLAAALAQVHQDELDSLVAETPATRRKLPDGTSAEEVLGPFAMYL